MVLSAGVGGAEGEQDDGGAGDAGGLGDADSGLDGRVFIGWLAGTAATTPKKSRVDSASGTGTWSISTSDWMLCCRLAMVAPKCSILAARTARSADITLT